MKKLLLPVGLLLLLTIAGCSSTSASKSNIIPIYTPPAGGSHYILAAGLTKIIKDADVMPDTVFSVQATSDEPSKIQKVIDGYEKSEPVFAIMASYGPDEAYQKGSFDNVKGDTTVLRAVGYAEGAPIHIVVPKDSPIQTYADLKGKTIGVFPGSAPEAMFKEILEVGYGYTEKDYKILPYDYQEVQQGIQDKSIEAGMLMGPIPSTLVRELQANEDVRVISVDDDVIEKYMEYKPGTIISTIEPGVYKNDEELKIPFVPGYIFTHENTDEELVYEIVKTMLENPEKMSAIHPTAKNINPESIRKGVGIPFHPGAEKYFEEKGITE